MKAGDRIYTACVVGAMAAFAAVAVAGWATVFATLPLGLIGVPWVGFLTYMLCVYVREKTWRMP